VKAAEIVAWLAESNGTAENRLAATRLLLTWRTIKIWESESQRLLTLIHRAALLRLNQAQQRLRFRRPAACICASTIAAIASARAARAAPLAASAPLPSKIETGAQHQK